MTEEDLVRIEKQRLVEPSDVDDLIEEVRRLHALVSRPGRWFTPQEMDAAHSASFQRGRDSAAKEILDAIATPYDFSHVEGAGVALSDVVHDLLCDLITYDATGDRLARARAVISAIAKARGGAR